MPLRTLYIDTAITGRFHYKAEDSRAQPHLCRLAMLTEYGHAVQSCHSMLIKPKVHWAFHPDAIAGHHITPELARECGVPLAEAFDLFTAELAKADVLVAFNADHHWQVMQATAWQDLGKTLEAPERTRRLCAQIRAISIVQIPDASGAIRTIMDRETGAISPDPEGRPRLVKPKFFQAYNFFVQEPPPLILDPIEFGAWMVQTVREIWHGIQHYKPQYRTDAA